MGKLLFVFSISFGSLFLGYALRKLSIHGKSIRKDTTESVSKNLKLAATFFLNPLPMIDGLWKLPLHTHGLFLLPLLGMFSLAVGGLSAVLFNTLFHIPPKRAASVFTSGTFTNIVTFGGLIAFVFYGVDGYGLVQFFNMFITAIYYIIGFPVSHQLSLETRGRFSFAPTSLKQFPYIFVPIAGVILGILFNLVGLARPLVLDEISTVLVPIVSAVMGFSIGITLHFSRVGGYRKEIGLVLLIKFVIVPVITIPVGLALGLPAMMGGLPFKVLVIVSFMPVAFNALVPPAVYGFDLDLANSAWIVSTLSLAVVLPALYLALLAG